MYAEDSFFTLTLIGRIGLIAVSAVLMMGTAGAVYGIARGRRLWLRLSIGAGAFVLFVWASPQVYYQYYHLLFDNLPWQWVIRWPAPTRLFGLLTFQAETSLSAHSQGALGWGLIATGLIARHKKIKAS